MTVRRATHHVHHLWRQALQTYAAVLSLDSDGFRVQANRATVLGREGEWAIHSLQVGLANEVNSTSEAEVTVAKKEGLGVVQRDGRLIDIASIKQAGVTVQMAAQFAAVG